MEFIVISEQEFESIRKDISDLKSLLLESNKIAFNSRLLSSEEVLKYLNISPKTLLNYRNKGIIGFSQIDSKIFYKMADIQGMLNKYYNKPFKCKKNMNHAVIMSIGSINKIMDRLEKLIDKFIRQKIDGGPNILSDADFCEIFQISKKTSGDWRRRKMIASIKIGNKIYYEMDEVKAIIKKNRNVA